MEFRRLAQGAFAPACALLCLLTFAALTPAAAELPPTCESAATVPCYESVKAGPDNYLDEIVDVNADGSVVVGNGPGAQSLDPRIAYKWENGVVTAIGLHEDVYQAIVTGVTGDGTPFGYSIPQLGIERWSFVGMSVSPGNELSPYSPCEQACHYFPARSSADGRVTVGYFEGQVWSQGDPDVIDIQWNHAIAWNDNENTVTVEILRNTSRWNGVSADGGIIVGVEDDTRGSPTIERGIVKGDVGFLSSFADCEANGLFHCRTRANAVSNTGVIVGAADRQTAPFDSVAVRWVNGQIESFLAPAYESTTAIGISADGGVIVGNSSASGGGPWRYLSATGKAESLFDQIYEFGYDYPGSSSNSWVAKSISSDGRTIVGSGGPVAGEGRGAAFIVRLALPGESYKVSFQDPFNAGGAGIFNTVGGSVSGFKRYHKDTVVAVTATPASGYHFVRWKDYNTNVQLSTSATYNFTLTEDVLLDAEFEQDTVNYTITTGVSPSGAGSVSGGGVKQDGASVTLVATANSGFIFRNWTEGATVLGTSSTLNFSASANRTITANFLRRYTITALASPTSGGTVSGAGQYTQGQTVSLTASPKTGYRFRDWTEGATVRSTAKTFSFSAGANRSLTANFVKQWTIALTASPSSGGTVSGGGTFDTNAQRTVTAKAKDGYKFRGWLEGDDIVSTAASYTFKLTKSRALKASFVSAVDITLVSSPSNAGTLTGAGTVQKGVSHSVKATAKAGYKFKMWANGSKSLSTKSVYSFVPTKDVKLTAHFLALPTCTLTATPKTLTKARSVKIAWTSKNAKSGKISGIGTITPVASGSKTITVKKSTTFTATFTGANGTGTCSVRVTVGASLITLHHFKGGAGDGADPDAGVAIDASGILRGATPSGGLNERGAIFAKPTAEQDSGQSLADASATAVQTFTSTSGIRPTGAVTLDRAGNLYGVAMAAGTADKGGIVYRIAAGETRASTVATFSRSEGTPNGGLIIGKDGTLFGTTSEGGKANSGTLFSLSPVAGLWKKQVLHNFAATDGITPRSGLVAGKDGHFYGTTSAGGAHNAGTVFRMSTASGAFAVLHNFTGDAGERPVGALAIDKHGALYGTTLNGGDDGAGTVFTLTPRGHGWEFESIHNFAAETGGAQPLAGVVIGRDGALYGTTRSGGAHNLGTIYEIVPSPQRLRWQFNILYDFGGADGALPGAGALILGETGALYGTTSAGGKFGRGTLFKFKEDTD